MVTISSDDSDIEKGIISLCETLEEKGGYIDDNLEIIDAKGSTSVFVGDEYDSDYLFKLPHELLVPYDHFDFDVEGQDIVIAHDDRNENAQHLKIVEAMIALYNRSGKFKTHLAEHPLLSYSKTPELIGHLLSAREGEDVDIVRNIIGKSDFFDELALLTFFKSRLLHCRLYSKQASRSAVLIPVIEFMNHHAQGAGFDNLYGKSESYLATQAAMPSHGSREAFTNYGRFDALDTFMHYGFVDQSAQYIRSIPLRIDLGDVGVVSVRGYSAVMPMDKVPEHLQDLAFYFPQMRYDQQRKFVEVSHLFIPQENARYSLRRVLEYIFQTLSPDMDEQARRACIGESENQILKMNADYYDSIEFMVRGAPENTTLSGAFLALSEMQKKKIVNYRSLVNA